MSICQQDYRSILQYVVSQFLYCEDINKICGANTYLNKIFIEDWRYVYRICLHHQPHNYDGEAVITVLGTQCWYKEGKLHREGDQPAIICVSGTQFWFKKGKLRREGDQPAIIFADGYKFRFKGWRRYRE